MILQDVLQTHVYLRSQVRLSGPVGKFDSSVCDVINMAHICTIVQSATDWTVSKP